MSDLRTYEHNIYSQNGEDGVLKEVFHRLSKTVQLDSWCVEFGAWDGVFLSNTCRLIREEKYKAVLIEGDSERFKQLSKNFPQNEVVKVCSFVGLEGDNSLENILSKTPIPKDFDFLSIDIDGMDYHIFKSVEDYRPKVVCVEFNPTIPNNVVFFQEKNFKLKQGSSARALVQLAKEKGYALVHATVCNLILVREDLRNFVTNEESSLEDLYTLGNDPTYLFVGYDGTLLSNKDQVNLVWHKLKVPIDWLQPLPNFLRIYRGDYGIIRHVASILWILLRRPIWVFRKIKRKLTKSSLR
jgi:hypothetical protein